MAPHDTNTGKEARRHAVPLIVMGVCLLLVLVGFLWWVANALQGPDETEASPVEEQETSQPVN
jgi:flagellar basal body-associated protein FliL